MKETIILADNKIVNAQQSISSMNSLNSMNSMNSIEPMECTPKASNKVGSFGVYLCLLITFVVICVCGRTVGEYNYYVANGISKQLLEQDFADDSLVTQGEKSFDAVSMEEEIWIYMEQILIPVLFDKDTVAGHNILLGGMRFRQLRVKREDCLHNSHIFPDCYPKWHSNYEDKTSFTISGKTYNWRTTLQNHEQESWYGTVDQYPGSGFVIDFSKNKTEILETITILKDSDYINKQTRILLVDTALYNPNLDVHTLIRLSFELPHTGGIQPHSEIKTWRLNRYGGTRGSIVLTFEIILLIIIIVITCKEIYNIVSYWNTPENKNSKCLYRFLNCFKLYFDDNRFNIIDLINLAFFWTTISLRIYEIRYDTSINMYSTTEYVSLRHIQYLFQLETQIQMVNGFLLWIKMFKYFTFSKRIRFLFNMFQNTATDLVIFMIVLFIFILAFATTAFLSFSSDVEEFRSLNSSILNLVRYAVTDMDLEKLTDSSLVVGPIFFVLWSLLMILILANVFIAIMCDAYNAVNDTHKDEPLGFNFGLNSILKRVKKFGTFFSNSFSSLDRDNDGTVNRRELVKSTGLNKRDAQLVIDTFDRDNDNKLDKHEFARAKRMLSQTDTSLNKIEPLEKKLTDIELSVLMNEIVEDMDKDREESDLERSRSIEVNSIEVNSIEINSIHLSDFSLSNKTTEDK